MLLDKNYYYYYYFLRRHCVHLRFTKSVLLAEQRIWSLRTTRCCSDHHVETLRQPHPYAHSPQLADDCAHGLYGAVTVCVGFAQSIFANDFFLPNICDRCSTTCGAFVRMRA